ncbi:phage protease [Desulfovibrio sp. OttesenSCG-928-G15]|nr:phage protease [Desulfovibrio sp. OttesenSCG-928-G15]
MNRLAPHHTVLCPALPDNTGIASLALALAAPAPADATDAMPMPEGCNVQLFPDGEFSAVDGRPGNLPKCETKVWRMDADIAATLITDIAALKTSMVFDYEHQTLGARDNGQPAPASGWLQSLVYVPGRGLFGRVNWTARAATFIAEQEYRYLSPTFTFCRKTGRITRLLHAALTNTPALDGLAAIAAARHFFTHDNPGTGMEEHMPEWLKKLFGLLGLDADATAEAATRAITDLAAKAARADAAEIALATAKAETTGSVDALAALQQEFTALRAELAEAREAKGREKLDAQILAALADGRLPKAMGDWARGLAKSNPEALEAYLSKAQPIAALKNMQTQAPDKTAPGAAADENAVALSEEEKYAAEQLGMSHADYAKAKKGAVSQWQ